jgi:hypothetical protein
MLRGLRLDFCQTLGSGAVSGTIEVKHGVHGDAKSEKASLQATTRDSVWGLA